MRRTRIVLLTAGCLCLSSSVAAQMGMELFKKPNIADIFRPVVGRGAVYEQQKSGPNPSKSNLEMTVVGKEVVDGQDAYWMEFGHLDAKSGQMAYGKMLVTKDDFKFHKVVFQQPGQPAMEMPFAGTGYGEKTRSRMQEEFDKWHSLGNETITVPAGTYDCVHWKKDTGVGDVWFNDKISPMGMVKSVSSNDTMVLVKLITDAKDHITGPVTKFDPETMKRQTMEQMQKQQKQQ